MYQNLSKNASLDLSSANGATGTYKILCSGLGDKSLPTIYAPISAIIVTGDFLISGSLVPSGSCPSN